MRSKDGTYRIKYKELDDVKWLEEQYFSLRRTTVDIAKELGCVPSTIYVALKRNGVSSRSISEARIGIVFSKEHLENIAVANKKKALSGASHPNWQGGKTKEWDKRMAAIKRDPDYKNWAKAVKSVGFCKSCGSRKKLEAHHILMKSTHPHLIHDIKNGMCLCKKCHATLHSKCGELLGTLEQTISSQAEVGILQKVQRLGAETRTVSNASTSAVRETDDIVRSS